MTQESITWSELSELTHATQVEKFNFCTCEDNEGKENPYADCPAKCADCKTAINEDDGCAWSELTEKSYCYDCEQSDLENASTLLKVHGDPEAEKVIFGDSFARGEYGDIPDWFNGLDRKSVV